MSSYSFSIPETTDNRGQAIESVQFHTFNVFKVKWVGEGLLVEWLVCWTAKAGVQIRTRAVMWLAISAPSVTPSQLS